MREKSEEISVEEKEERQETRDKRRRTYCRGTVGRGERRR